MTRSRFSLFFPVAGLAGLFALALHRSFEAAVSWADAAIAFVRPLLVIAFPASAPDLAVDDAGTAPAVLGRSQVISFQARRQARSQTLRSGFQPATGFFIAA